MIEEIGLLKSGVFHRLARGAILPGWHNPAQRPGLMRFTGKNRHWLQEWEK
jgi:hypothetical protein